LDDLKNKKTFVFDLDKTLCNTPEDSLGAPIYKSSTPIVDRINKVNKLYKDGNKIIIDTARGSNSGVDYYDLTYNQLNEWGLKFNILRTGIKFSSDFYIDDKALNHKDFF
jgi:hypothetical protein